MSRWRKRILAILLILAGSSGVATAEEASGAVSASPALALDRFSLRLMRFTCNREMQTPEIECADYYGRVAADFDVSILKYGFWRNEVHGEGTKAKFMTIGWRWEMGIALGKVELLWEHHSRHTMDQEQPYYWNTNIQSFNQAKYPVEDSYGIRINFYQRER
jgi:hypothetical protein